MNREENSTLAPILSAVAGMGAILIALSPLFVNNGFINSLFIDERSIAYCSLISLINIIIVIWLTSSFSFHPFIQSRNPQLIKIQGIILFSLFTIIFYICRVLADNTVINTGIASVIQVIAYILAFIFLSTTIGLILRDTLESLRRKRIDETKLEKIKDILVKSGIIKVNLRIVSLTKHQYMQGEPTDWMYAYDVCFDIDENDQYVSMISDDFSQILYCEKRIPRLEDIEEGKKII